MKVLEIGGCNLASLKGEFRIALDKVPFSGEGLFAIRGVTGSGKSTLIDAMCLALYDDTPRFVGKGGPEIGLAGQKDRLKATDPRGILHRGTALGWAEVVFRGVDGARWRAKWTVARARKKADGNFQNQVMELENLDTGERPGGTRTEVLERIQEKVGLTFDQFRRSVLLAQGEFAAFAKANQDERANLLEAMTGTDIYARISVAAQKRCVLEDQKLKGLHVQRDALGLMSEDLRREKDIQVGDLGTQIQQQEQEQTEVQRGLAWHERSATLERQCAEAADKLGSAEIAHGGAEDRRILLQRVERAQPLRDLHSALGLALKHRTALDTQIQDRQSTLPEAEREKIERERVFLEKQEVLQKVVEGIATAKPHLDAARELDTKLQESAVRVQALIEESKALEEAAQAAEQERDTSERQEKDLSEKVVTVEAELEASVPMQALAQSWIRAEKDIEDFAKASNDLQQAAQDLKGIQTTLKEQQEQHASAKKNMVERVAELSDLRLALDDLAKRVAEDPRKILDSMRKTHQVTLDRLRLAESVLLRLHRMLSQHADAEEEAKAYAVAKAQAKTDLDEALQGLPPVDGGLKEARAAWERAQAALSLEERRTQLVSGEPCPLCGSVEHPWAKGSPLVRLLEAQAKQVTELEDRKSELEQAIAKARTRIAESEKAESKALEKAKAHAVDVLKEDDAWQGIRSQAPELPEDSHSAHALTVVREGILDQDEHLEDIGRREGTLLNLEKQVEELRRKEREAEDTRVELDGQLRLAEEEIRNLVKNETEYLRDIKNLDSRTKGLREALATVLDHEFMAELDQDPASLRTRLGTAVAKRLATETSQTKLKQKLVDVARALEGQKATATEKRSGASAGADKRDEAARAKEKLQELRKAFFGGRTVHEVEQGLEADRKTADQAVEDSRNELQSAEQAFGGLRNAITTLLGQLELAQKAVDSSQSRFLEAMSQQWEGDLESLESCLEWTPEQIQIERSALQALETVCASAGAVLEAHQKALSEHLASDLPELPKEALEARAVAIKEVLDDLNRAVGGLQADLQRDEQARRNAEALALAIRDQEDQARLWNEMNALVGSSDGKKFRTFAQSLTLEALLVFANEQLSRLTPRYRLQRVPNCELEIQVIDQDMGDEIRALNSLSGGETFLVSLALALGLSSLSASDTPIDSLFIDEGFGTLDSETLETALSVLDELQAQGRQVGIISHVEGLATHIPVQIRIEKLGGGRSRMLLPEPIGA